MWKNRKYVMSWIVRKLNSVESNNCTYLAVHNDGVMNQLNNETYDIQCPNGKKLWQQQQQTNVRAWFAVYICTSLKDFISTNMITWLNNFTMMILKTTNNVTSK